MFTVMGVLKVLSNRVHSPLLDKCFSMIEMDERAWMLLLRDERAPAEDHEEEGPVQLEIKRFTDLLFEFVKKIDRKSDGAKVKSLAQDEEYSEEVLFSERVYSRGAHLHVALLGHLKPQFAEAESFLETRHGPIINLKALYPRVAAELECPEVWQSLKAARLQMQRLAGTTQALHIPTHHADSSTGPVDEEVLRSLSRVSFSGAEFTVDHEKDEDSEEEEQQQEKEIYLGHEVQADQMYPPPPPTAASLPLPHLEIIKAYVCDHTSSICRAERIVDSYYLVLTFQLSVLAVTEMVENAGVFSDTLTLAHSLASHFIRLGLPLLEQICSLEPSFIKENVFALSMSGIEKGKVYGRARQLVRKVKLLSQMFSALDLFLFPPQVKAHEGGCKAIAVSTFSSRYVVTGGYDMAIRLWDMETLKCLAQFVGHTSIVTWVCFGSMDKYIYSGSFDGTIRKWNTHTCTAQEFKGHEAGITDGCLMAKDQYLLSASMDCSVRMWNVGHGECIRKFKGHRHWVKNVLVSPDQSTVVTSSLDNQVFTWKVRQGGGNVIIPHIKIPLGETYSLDMAILGADVLAVAAKDSTVKIYHVSTGKLQATINCAGMIAQSLSMSPDGKLLAVGVFEYTVLLYNTSDFELLRTI